MTDSGLWENDDFEMHLISGIVGLYETRPNKFKFANPLNKVSDAEINKVKQMGLYFSAGDRISYADFVDIKLPNLAINSFIGEEKRESNASAEELIFGYVRHIYAEKIKRLPPEFLSPLSTGTPYAFYHMHCFQEDGLMIAKDYGFINKNGNSIPLKIRDTSFYPFKDQLKKDLENNTIILATTLNFYDDRRNLWNVQATEREAKVLFGIYPEQIKSLFYSRSIPVTDAGRKRPILHWVSAHKKRLSRGIDINIDKYLRGITQFEMNGTKFEIQLPIKGA